MDYLQFIQLSHLTVETKKEILKLNEKYGTKPEWKKNIEIFEPKEDGTNGQLMINIDVQDKDYPYMEVEEEITSILKKSNIKFIISGAS